jgi:hypothetical protein
VSELTTQEAIPFTRGRLLPSTVLVVVSVTVTVPVGMEVGLPMALMEISNGVEATEGLGLEDMITDGKATGPATMAFHAGVETHVAVPVTVLGGGLPAAERNAA